MSLLEISGLWRDSLEVILFFYSMFKKVFGKLIMGRSYNLLFDINIRRSFCWKIRWIKMIDRSHLSFQLTREYLKFGYKKWMGIS